MRNITVIVGTRRDDSLATLAMIMSLLHMKYFGEVFKHLDPMTCRQTRYIVDWGNISKLIYVIGIIYPCNGHQTFRQILDILCWGGGLLNVR